MTDPPSRKKQAAKYLIVFLKFSVPIAIMVYLLARVPEERLHELRDRPKHWGLLAGALLTTLTAVSLTFVRWYMLVVALGLPFRLRDAFRLGFLGYLFNFISVGSVGGDLFKAIFIARELPRRKAEAVATVILDRILGLYALLLLTSLVVLSGGLPESVEIKVICQVALVLTGIGGVGILMLLVPGFTSGAVSEFLTGLPFVGPTMGKLIAAVRIYRTKWIVLFTATLMSIVTHSLFVVAIYLMALGLFDQVPTLKEHFIIVPLAMVAGAVPFLPAGLGAFEGAMAFLYEQVPAAGTSQVSGVIVALTYRLTTILVAMIGVVYYWTSRKEVQEVQEAMEEAEHAAES